MIFFGKFYCTCLPPVAAGLASGGVDFDDLLPDRDLTQKLHNKLYNVHNNNINVLKIVQKLHQLYTRRTTQLAV